MGRCPSFLEPEPIASMRRLTDVKIVRSLVLVALLVPALVVVGASSALACSCVPRQPDHKAIEDAAAVFSGTVVDAEDGADAGLEPVTWVFEVDTVHKGDVSPTHEVTSHTQSAACGFAFTEGKRYVVFAYEEAGELQTNSCLNTRALAEDRSLDLPVAFAYDTAEPGPPAPEEPVRDTSRDETGWDPFVVGSLAIVAVFGALTVVALATGRRKKPLDAALVREELE